MPPEKATFQRENSFQSSIFQGAAWIEHGNIGKAWKRVKWDMSIFGGVYLIYNNGPLTVPFFFTTKPFFGLHTNRDDFWWLLFVAVKVETAPALNSAEWQGKGMVRQACRRKKSKPLI